VTHVAPTEELWIRRNIGARRPDRKAALLRADASSCWGRGGDRVTLDAAGTNVVSASAARSGSFGFVLRTIRRPRGLRAAFGQTGTQPVCPPPRLGHRRGRFGAPCEANAFAQSSTAHLGRAAQGSETAASDQPCAMLSVFRWVTTQGVVES
jgi:hypothetical protein